MPVSGKSGSTVGSNFSVLRVSNYPGDRSRASVPIHPLCTSSAETPVAVVWRVGSAVRTARNPGVSYREKRYFEATIDRLSSLVTSNT